MMIDNQLDGNKEELLEDTLEELIEETGKWSKEEALYVEVPEIDHDCQKCCFYQNGSCELVDGEVKPEGHCRFWVQSCPKDEVETYSLSQSVADLEAEDEGFLYILDLLQDTELPNYQFEAILENLANDLSTETQELSASKSVSLKIGKHKDRDGGLTPEGIKKLNRETGSNLKPGVLGKPKTLDDFYRKGKFLLRFYNQKKIPPLKKPNGKPTRFALAATRWSEPVPSTLAAVRRLAAKGKGLMDRYKLMKEKAKSKKSKQKLSQSELPNLPLLLSNGMVKIPIAKKGNFFHEQHGIVSFTDEDFAQIKKESSKEVLGFTPYITYGHPTDLPYNTIDGELKKGDLKGWEEDNDVLFGLFEAKEDVFNLVKNGEYEYSSGEFLRNYKDKFTGVNKGTVLMRVALTNSPFIPFGDTKVEALSQQSNTDDSCLPKSIPFVIKLSTDIQENINPPISEEDSPELNMQVEKTPEQLAEEVVSKLIPESESKVEPTVIEPTKESPVVNKTIIEEPKKEEVKVAASPTASSVDVNALFEKFAAQAAESTKTAVDAVSSKYEAVVSGLNSQIEALKSQLSNQEQVTQAFSTSLSNQAKLQEQKEMLGYGIKPTLIQKFSQIQSALETKQTVVKLSTKAADGQVSEVETPIVNALKELLIDAVYSEPVNLQQFGQSANKIPATGLMAAINGLAEENKTKAAKRSL